MHPVIICCLYNTVSGQMIIDALIILI